MSGCKRTSSLRLNLRYLSVRVRNIILPDDTRVLSNSDKKVPGVAGVVLNNTRQLWCHTPVKLTDKLSVWYPAVI
ncbi:hypothetical protein J6590_091106 [Homalodisca vitripennis]|nr:hypothetical protein J6590_091106 [Homalodisca vitripennis]